MNQHAVRSGLPFYVLAAIVLASACQPSDGPSPPSTREPARALAQESSVPVYLNHAFTVVPTATYRALRDSAWLNTEFSRVEERTTVRPDLTYTGVYLLFERTYLELFEVGPAFPVEAGALALSDETAGGKDWVAERMVALFGQDRVLTGIISRTVDGQPVPWFHYAFPEGVFSELFSTWNMEFVTRPGAASPPRREEGLAPYYQPEKLASNVAAVAYALDAADAGNLRDMLAALDWETSDLDAGRFLALSPTDGGTRRAVVVQPATATCTGITALAIALSRHADHVEEMGGARLEVGIFGKKLALLSLRPSACADDLRGVVATLGN
jgi:hypothetical protein